MRALLEFPLQIAIVFMMLLMGVAWAVLFVVCLAVSLVCTIVVWIIRVAYWFDAMVRP